MSDNERKPIGIPVEEFIKDGKEKQAIYDVMSFKAIFDKKLEDAREMGIPLKLKVGDVFVDSFEVHIDPNGVTNEEGPI